MKSNEIFKQEFKETWIRNKCAFHGVQLEGERKAGILVNRVKKEQEDYRKSSKIRILQTKIYDFISCRKRLQRKKCPQKSNLYNNKENFPSKRNY